MGRKRGRDVSIFTAVEKSRSENLDAVIDSLLSLETKSQMKTLLLQLRSCIISKLA